jgi:Zn-dependent protease with chaperone function
MKNFFEHQAAARRKTGWLIAYYVAAIIGTVILTYLLVTAIYAVPAVKAGQKFIWFNPLLLLGVAVAVLGLVGGCTAFKVVQLASGGSAVALMMGGRELGGRVTDPKEKRLLNVVEEMALAAGIPVPPVYVLEDEKGINAFAAGYSPNGAIVAVSRGCLNYLTRDELQGVVAHEFSHILNGDMRLNIRLIATVFGIMGLAMVGSILLRASWFRSASSSDNRRDSGSQLALLGIGLYLLGIVGAFFGNLIKAAVSRQREFLADASAVQFTRNPDGIGGALKKIGGLSKGSTIENPHAPEASHMFFADALRANRFVGLFATHPPLEARIQRVLPNWDGEFPKVKPLGEVDEVIPVKPARRSPFAAAPTLPGMPNLPIPVLTAVAEDSVQRVGTVTPAQTEYAANLLDALPEEVTEAAHDPFSARALVYCLLLNTEPEVRERQLTGLRMEAEARDVNETMRLMRHVDALPETGRLPVLDLAMPALRRMSPNQHATFRKQVDRLIAADNQVSLFEFVLGSVLRRNLDAAFGIRPALPGGATLGGATGHARVVLSRLAWEGADDDSAARRAYDAGMRRFLGGENPPGILPPEQCDFAELEKRLRLVAAGPPAAKQRLLVGCAACIAADRKVTERESELYRAVGNILGVPVPPLTV